MGCERVQVIGVDHHRSPVALRERMAVAGAELPEVLRELGAEEGVEEAVVLSTCNRTEYYLVGGDGDLLLRHLAERQGVDAATLQAHCYRLHGPDAVRHLFRVAASLESMVVGEYQILHQVRHAYEQARLHGTVGASLNQAFQRAIAVGKDVRSETGIGRHKLSVASVAVDLALHIHGRLDGRGLLLVGAGEMAELALRHFVKAGVRSVAIVNRNRERAESLCVDDAEGVTPQVLHWGELDRALGEHDIVVSSTAAAGAVVTVEMVRQAMSRRRDPLMLIDLAVPRDVEGGVATIDEVYLYNIDHLDQVVAANRRLREDEVDGAAALVERRLTDFLREGDPERSALLRVVAGWFDDLVQEESDRLLGRLGLEPGHGDELRYGLRRVGNKLQHRLFAWLRTQRDQDAATRVLREILDLDAWRSGEGGGAEEREDGDAGARSAVR